MTLTPEQFHAETNRLVDRLFQTVIITLDDGRKLSYSGMVHEGIEGRKVVAVTFIEPQPLPPDCHFEQLTTKEPDPND